MAATTLQSGLATAEAHTIEKSFLQETLQNEGKKKIAKDEIETDVNDLAERSGRADKVSSQVTFIYYIVLTFCMYLDWTCELHVTISEPLYLIDSLALRDNYHYKYLL